MAFGLDAEERKERTREEAERFLDALEKNMTQLIELSKAVEEEATRYDVSAFDRFRDELQNFRSLSILIEARLEELSGERKAELLKEQFDQLQALMLSTFIRTCMKTFFVYSTKTVLSLGSKERFLADLRFLNEAQERLSDGALKARLDDTALDDLEIARDILGEIIANAPGLLNFGGEEN